MRDRLRFANPPSQSLTEIPGPTAHGRLEPAFGLAVEQQRLQAHHEPAGQP